jgi:dolichol-phosphate mannosyltransferase
MIHREQVCVLLPTLDEAATIGDVVESFREQGFEDVFVIDGGSQDGTQDLAREAGARVMEQSGSGKGQAVQEALDAIDAKYVLMADGDGTYRAADAEQMLEPLFDGRAEHVIGNRFANMEPGAMSRLNRIGNRLLNFAFRLIHHRDLNDILSGYRAFTMESAEQMGLSAGGFGIETEMAVECVKKGIDTAEVPITYRPRPDGSETNLNPLVHGALIGLTIYKLAKTNNPLFYFGSVGTLSMLTGTAIAAYVGYEFFVRDIPHEGLAVVASAGILLGVQLLMFGVLSDMIVSLHREQLRRIEQLRPTTTAEPSESVSPDEIPADSGVDSTTSTEADGDTDTAATSDKPLD